MQPKMTVLLVDDDEIIRDLVELALSDEGHNVIVAPHGKAALDLLHDRQLDLILLDMCMPTMDGWEFSRMYAMTPGPHAPIVVLTAAYHPVSPIETIGAAGFLAKPFDVDDLIHLVKRYEDRKASAG